MNRVLLGKIATVRDDAQSLKSPLFMVDGHTSARSRGLRLDLYLCETIDGPFYEFRFIGADRHERDDDLRKPITFSVCRSGSVAVGDDLSPREVEGAVCTGEVNRVPE
ncbi:hypothetical protein [Bosea sp. Root670]|uniref:hypothetical protein n=1 Tax=Bosea sp. Root670 TaxID=1736583 RepID=UPI0012E3CD8F|nr:hypothetical protein [Bosea sp. Root670]